MNLPEWKPGMGCRLNLDSPSYPPELDEYRQCGCPSCFKYLEDLEKRKELMRTREEHIKWCQERAFKEFDFYLVHDGLQPAISNGLTSMASDLRKHPETNDPTLIYMCVDQMKVIKTPSEFREFINGF